MALTEEEKQREEIQDRFLLVQVLSLVREFLADKREREKQVADQLAVAKPKSKEKHDEV